MSHIARKRFGQNFLHDVGVIQHIVSLVGPEPGQHIVEIGPGKGALTQYLLKETDVLDVIELDRDLIPVLERVCAGLGELRIHSADVLRFDFAALATDGRPLRLVGNLPYNISTPLLFHVLEKVQCVQDMHFMLQKEVVQRMAASPGDPDYGRLSVMIQYYCYVDPLFLVDPDAFSPAPKVESMVVRLVPHTEPRVQVTSTTHFAAVVKQAFAQRRKTLRNTLKGLLSEDQIRAQGIDPTLRAETLSLEQFAKLSNALQ